MAKKDKRKKGNDRNTVRLEFEGQLRLDFADFRFEERHENNKAAALFLIEAGLAEWIKARRKSPETQINPMDCRKVAKMSVLDERKPASALNGHGNEVIEALQKHDQRFISAEKIARDLNLAPADVRSFLDAHADIVRRADVRDQNGNPLYARADQPITIIERWGRLYSYINKEPLPSYRPGK